MVDSWLAKYLQYTKRQESPENFHVWTGVAIMAAAMGRKVWMDRRSGGVTRYRIYPGQIMVVLTAGSGVVRKSTAIGPATNFLKLVNKPIISGKSSVEAFLKQMDGLAGGTPQAVLIESELTNFISKASYLDPLIEVLCKLHDAEDEFPYTTLGHGKIIIKEPCLTMLACTTPENMGNRLPASAHGSGFMSRIIFVFAKTTDRLEDLSDVEDEDLNPDEIKKISQVETDLRNGLSMISSMAGPVSFSKDARLWFRNFYREWVQSPAGQGEGYPTRKPDHLLRVAITLMASENQAAPYILEDRHLVAAKRILANCEKDFDKAFAYIGTSFTKDRQRILDFIAGRGGTVTTVELFNSQYIYFKDKETLQRTLSLLSEAGILQEKIDNTTNPSTQTWSLKGITFKF